MFLAGNLGSFFSALSTTDFRMNPLLFYQATLFRCDVDDVDVKVDCLFHRPEGLDGLHTQLANPRTWF